MPAALDRYWTRDEVLALPDDGNRYELVYGELLVSPSPTPRHQVIVVEIVSALREYTRRHGIGRVLLSPADISWGRPQDVIAQPDVFVVAGSLVHAARWDEFRDFHLFVEVLSPSTARYDRFTKRRLYQEMGVPLYWIIDTVKRRGEVWTPGAVAPTYEERTLTWHPDGAPEPFSVQLEELLAS